MVISRARTRVCAWSRRRLILADMCSPTKPIPCCSILSKAMSLETTVKPSEHDDMQLVLLLSGKQGSAKEGLAAREFPRDVPTCDPSADGGLEPFMVLLSGKKDSEKAGLAAREVPPECIGPGTLLHELTDAGIASIGQKPRGPSGPVAATTVELSRLETGLNCRGLYVSHVKDGGCGRMVSSPQSFSSCMSPAPSRSCSSCTGPAPKPLICFSSFSSLEASSDTNSPAVARLILVIGHLSLFFSSMLDTRIR